MAKKRMTVPAVRINNETWGIIPNTLVYNAGEGEIKVEAISIGGGKSETVHGQDITTAIGMVKFDVATTDDLDAKIRELKQAIAENGVSFLEKIGSQIVKRTFTGMSLANSVERAVGSDGKTSLEFQGDPMEGAQ